MTNEKLYEVLGDINEKHVYEARAYHKAKKSIWAKWGVMAACLCLIVAGTVAMLHQPKYDTMTGDPIKDAGGGISGGSEMAGCYSIAVFPDTKSEDSVEIAEVITLSETEVKNNSLSVHLPQALPEGFYTALQQKTVDGQENPLPAIDAASVQEVQKYVSLWNANYD